MEKVLNDLKYCSEYYNTIDMDSKCCGGLNYQYLIKCCNCAELNNVYEIIIKLFAINYVLTFDYPFFLNNFKNIFEIFQYLKREEEVFLSHLIYYDNEYLKKMRQLHIFNLYKNRGMFAILTSSINVITANNHFKILISIFYQLCIDNLIEKDDFINIFRNDSGICLNLVHNNMYNCCDELRVKYMKLLNN